MVGIAVAVLEKRAWFGIGPERLGVWNQLSKRPLRPR